MSETPMKCMHALSQELELNVLLSKQCARPRGRPVEPILLPAPYHRFTLLFVFVQNRGGCEVQFASVLIEVGTNRNKRLLRGRREQYPL